MAEKKKREGELLKKIAQLQADNRRLKSEQISSLQAENRQLRAEIEDLHHALNIESSSIFRMVMEDTKDAILITDARTGKIIDVNEATCSLLGYSREEILQLAAKDVEVAYLETPELWHIYGKDVQRTGDTHFLPQGIQTRKDGTKFPVEVSISYKSLAGRAYLVIVYRDITERKQVEEKLEVQARMLENMAEGVHAADEQHHLIYTNPAFDAMFGYARGELLGQPISLLNAYPPEENALMVHEIHEALIRKGYWSGEFLNYKKDKTVFTTSANITQFSLEDKNIWISVQEDITERKRAEAELVAAKVKAEEMNKLKNSFLANMSHELRTPMNGIIGFASILKEELVGAEQYLFADRILKSGERLLKTINDILDLAKLEAQKQELELRTLNLVEECQAAISFLEPLATKKGLFLKVLAEQENVSAFLDRKAFNQIINNLVGNALKFTLEGGVSVHIDLYQEGSRPWARLRVSDTGVGISDKFLPYIFDEFRQESTGHTRHFEGTGLGLTITKKLVELMQGTIAADSMKRKGSVFTVLFPLVPPAVGRNHLEEEESLSELVSLSETFAVPRVLLVEDDMSNQDIVSIYLEQVCKVETVMTGTEALERIRQQQYAAVLLDINLGPDINGVDTLRALRQLSKGPQLAVVAITAYAMKGDRERFLAAGFDAYIPKPFSKQELLSVMHKIFHQHKHRLPLK